MTLSTTSEGGGRERARRALADATPGHGRGLADVADLPDLMRDAIAAVEGAT